ncbi:MAG: hypothetical protein RIS35_3288, partial [Pseudomonadota bacterium]
MSTLDPTEIPGNDSTTRQIFGTSSVDADFSLIDSGFDRDWFRIDLSADVPYYFRVQSSEYLFDVTGLPDDTPLLSDPAVSLYSPTVGYIPRLQRDAEGAGKDYAFLVFTPSASGTYYVEASAASGGTGAYRISAGPLDWALPTGIAPQLVLPAGGTVAVDAPIVLATEGDLPNPGRGTAVLYKGEGPSRTFVTDFNFNAPSATNMTLSWADATVRLDPPGTLEPGTVYTLSVREDFLRNRIDEPSAAIEFRFTTAGSAPGSGDDHPNDAAAGTAIAVDAPATGVIGAARDVDWFRVTLAAGATYAVTLDRTDVSATLDPFLVLQQPDGTTLTNDDVAIGNRNARIEFTAPTSGTYALRASDVFQQKTGAYRISVTEIVIDDHGDDAADATLMSPGTAADGSLERDGDIDWFRVEL